MADPLSISTGAIAIIGICIKLGRFCREAKDGFSKTDAALDRIAHQARNLQAVMQELQTAVTSQKGVQRDWTSIETAVHLCSSVTTDLDTMMTKLNKNVAKQSGPTKLDKFGRYFKHQLKEAELDKECARLESCRNQLHSAMLVFIVREEVSRGPVETAPTREAEIPKIDCKYFDIPQTVSSLYTGRVAQLETLKACAFKRAQPTGSTKNKRFIVYGVAGSGKTQFCCKFASVNKQRFWAVYTIDASSSADITRSLASIAKTGDKDASPAAVKNWLSCLGPSRPWLLIINNADDGSIKVEDYFPDSEHGVTLVTTRNPQLRIHGTIGPRFFHFDQLDEEASVKLFLRAAFDTVEADQTEDTLEVAREVCKELGYLPLALLHAGKTILANQCTVQNYLDYYRRSWASVQRVASRDLANEDAATAIYSTFEVLYDSLVRGDDDCSRDAVAILGIAAYLHHQHIRKDIFSRTTWVSTADEKSEKDKDREDNEVSRFVPTPKLRSEIIREFVTSAVEAMFYPRIAPNLPVCLTAKNSITGLWDDVRLNRALEVLSRLGLIDFSPESRPGSQDESFSIHPAVQEWLRERPRPERHIDRKMDHHIRAVDCHLAANVLSQAIRLPPFDDSEAEEIFKRDILPHVIQNIRNERKIAEGYDHRQAGRLRTWPSPKASMTRNRALQLTKFSVVYAQGGHLDEAEKLQQRVLDYVVAKLGNEHPKATSVMLLMSKTYWRMARTEDAVELQEHVLKTYNKTWGSRHVKTLRVMTYYASLLWLQGRIPRALQLLRSTLDGYSKLSGTSWRADMFRAKSDYGRAVGKDFGFDEAVQIEREAVAGLEKELSPHHLDTITAMDNLAMAYFDRVAYARGHAGDLDRANAIEEEVFRLRKEKLGREHLDTLWASLNLSRIKGLRGEIDEAMALRAADHEIAVRVLPPNIFKIAILFARAHTGRILMYAKRYQEAETLLTEVVNGYPEKRKYHPDRLIAIFSLVKARQVLGIENEVKELLNELLMGVESIWGPNHAYYKWVQDLCEDGEQDGHSIGDTEPAPHKLGDAAGIEMIARVGHAARVEADGIEEASG